MAISEKEKQDRIKEFGKAMIDGVMERTDNGKKLGLPPPMPGVSRKQRRQMLKDVKKMVKTNK